MERMKENNILRQTNTNMFQVNDLEPEFLPNIKIEHNKAKQKRWIQGDQWIGTGIIQKKLNFNDTAEKRICTTPRKRGNDENN